jgi:drug/metabolite transporter (DMT)-like permease
VNRHADRPWRAAGLAAAAALCLAGMSAVLKGAMRDGATLGHAVFFRSAVTALCAGGLAAGLRQRLRGLPWRILLLRSLLGGTAMTLAFFAVRGLPLGDAETLHRSSPVFVVLLAWPVLGERPTAAQGALVGAAFLGAVLVMRPSFSLSALPAAAGILAAALAAGAYLCLRWLAKGTPVTLIVLVFTGSTALAAAPFAAAAGWPAPVVPRLLLAGGLGTLGKLLMSHAYRFAAAAIVSTLLLLAVVFAALFGALEFGEAPGSLTLAGMALVVGACALLTCVRNVRPGGSLPAGPPPG